MQSAPTQSLDSRSLRSALGQYSTGVTIVTCRRADGQAVGLTVNSFAALSLEPALVLWSLRLTSSILAPFDAARHFAINVLSESQVDLARRFSSAIPAKFEHGGWHDGLGGVPLLAGCAATLECEPSSIQDAGDHRLYIGHVLRARADATAPLVYHGGHFHLLGEVL